MTVKVIASLVGDIKNKCFLTSLSLAFTHTLCVVVVKMGLFQ